MLETEVRGRRRYEAETFIKTMPETMSKAAASRTTFIGSPRAAMPTRNEPTAPLVGVVVGWHRRMIAGCRRQDSPCWW